MAHKVNIPRTAITLDAVTGILPTGRWTGEKIHMAWYVGEISMGASTKYQRVPCEWIRFEISRPITGEVIERRAFQYTGKNLAAAARQMHGLKAALAAVAESDYDG